MKFMVADPHPTFEANNQSLIDTQGDFKDVVLKRF
jgi:hypothetical protein